MSRLLNFKWDNHVNMVNEFKNFLLMETMTDVTLACDGQSLKVHKIILSAFSPYFKSLFLENPCQHPIVICRDIKYTELKSVIDFMYSGEINLTDDKISAVINTAKTLKVKGLGELEFQNEVNEDESALCDEFERRSEGESSEKSIYSIGNSNLDLQNSHVAEIEERSDESDDGMYEPEIKREIFLDDSSVPNSPTPLQSHSVLPIRETLLERSVKQTYDDKSQKHFQSPGTNLTAVFPGDKSPKELPMQSVKELKQNSKYDNSFSSVPFASKPSSDAFDYDMPGSSTAPSCKKFRKTPVLRINLKDFTKKEREKPALKKNASSSSKQVQGKSRNTSSTKYKLKCGVCMFMTKNSQDLKYHMATSGHEGAMLYQCDQCSHCSKIKKNLERHITAIHEKIKPYTCYLCSRKFAEPYLLKKHFSRVHEGKKEHRNGHESKMLKCKKCDFSALDKASIKEHMSAVHVVKDDFICPKCPTFRSPSKKGIMRHMEKEHEE